MTNTTLNLPTTEGVKIQLSGKDILFLLPHSKLLKSLQENELIIGEKESITIERVTDFALNEIKLWCEYENNEIDNPSPLQPKKGRNGIRLENLKWENELSSRYDSDVKCYEVLQATNYLNMVQMSGFVTRVFADRIVKKSPEEVRQLFRMKYDPASSSSSIEDGEIKRLYPHLK